MSPLPGKSTYVNMSIMTPSPCCPPVLRKGLRKSDAEELASAFKALADPVRLQLLSFIASQSDGEACVCHLVEPAGLSQPTVSHHLKLLHGAGLLERDKRGAWVYYRVRRERLEALRSALATSGVAAPRKAKRA
jgi:ArsR family transcriptional regulator, arsenate/arsenite/antimonite-responsive transcriptional repressor